MLYSYTLLIAWDCNALEIAVRVMSPISCPVLAPNKPKRAQGKIPREVNGNAEIILLFHDLVIRNTDEDLNETGSRENRAIL